MSVLAERLGDLDLYANVTLELADGTTVEGRASPIDFFPERHLRLEIRPMGEGSASRYEVHAQYRDGEWEPPVVREIVPADGEEWKELGELADFAVAE